MRLLVFSSLSPQYKHAGGQLLSLFIIVVVSGSSANSKSLSLRSSNVWKNSCVVIISQVTLTQRSPTAATPSQHPHKQLLCSGTPFNNAWILQPLRMVAEKNVIAQPSNANQMEIMRLTTLPCGGSRQTRAGDEKQVILLYYMSSPELARKKGNNSPYVPSRLH